MITAKSLRGRVVLAATTLAFCAVAFGATAGDQPELALRINGHGIPAPEALTLYRGEPLVIEVQLTHADRNARTPLLLAPPGGEWSSRVKIAVVDATGTPAPWPLAVSGKPSPGSLALQPGTTTTLVLRLDSKALSTIVPGSYTISAQLDLADGGGWRGIVESERAEISVIEPAHDVTDEKLAERQLLRIREALLAGDFVSADAVVTDMLNPAVPRPEGYVALALLSAAKGKGRLALIYLDMAMAHAAKGANARPTSGTPPTEENTFPLEYYDLQRRFELIAENEPESIVPPDRLSLETATTPSAGDPSLNPAQPTSGPTLPAKPATLPQVATAKSTSAALPQSILPPSLTKPPVDQGARDISDFPRPDKAFRKSFSQMSLKPAGSQENATYVASGTLEEVRAFYTKSLAAQGWSEGSHLENNNAVGNRPQIIMNWKRTSRASVITIAELTTGGVEIRARVTTIP